MRQISNKPEDVHLETLDCLKTNVQTWVSNCTLLKKNRTWWHWRRFIARKRERERTERSPPATTLTQSKFVRKQAAESGLWLAPQREKHQICNKYGSNGWIIPFWDGYGGDWRSAIDEALCKWAAHAGRVLRSRNTLWLSGSNTRIDTWLCPRRQVAAGSWVMVGAPFVKVHQNVPWSPFQRSLYYLWIATS